MKKKMMGRIIDNKWNICKKKFRQYLYTQKKIIKNYYIKLFCCFVKKKEKKILLSYWFNSVFTWFTFFSSPKKKVQSFRRKHRADMNDNIAFRIHPHTFKRKKLFCVILSVKHFYRMGLKLFKCTKENKINYK
jgi:hypothetical protein